LTFPHGVAVDSAGNLYIAADFRIRKVSNGVITTIAGNGEYGFNGDNRPATTAAMNPFGVAVDPGGSLYIVDSTNFRIRKVSSGIITTVAGDGKTGGFSGDNGPAVSARLDRPTSIAADASGNVYIADYRNGCIRRVSNGLISTVAGGGSSLADNIPATSSRLSPISVAVDSSGNLYIADLNNRVRKVSYGMITTVAGTGTAGFSGDNGPAISAQLSSPQAVAVDSSGNLYIGDGNRVRKISGGIITTVAGNGTGGAAVTAARLPTPSCTIPKVSLWILPATCISLTAITFVSARSRTESLRPWLEMGYKTSPAMAAQLPMRK
jgi:hypothetical protein